MRSLARRDVTGRGKRETFRARVSRVTNKHRNRFRPASLTETDGETRAFERVDRSRSTGELRTL